MKEIERKFLVGKIPEDIYFVDKIEIIQFYLCSSNDVITRVRKYGEKYNIGIKKGQGTVRLEKEIEISEKDFYDLTEFNSDRRIKKYRYRTRFNNYIIELDEFLEKLSGLILAEVEFKTIEEANSFIPPQWFGLDVSEDIKYTNSSLSVSQKIP